MILLISQAGATEQGMPLPVPLTTFLVFPTPTFDTLIQLLTLCLLFMAALLTGIDATTRARNLNLLVKTVSVNHKQDLIPDISIAPNLIC